MAITSKTETKSPPENAQKLTPATDVAASGAFIEPEIVSGVDTGHVSVDNNPRKGSTADMNRVDFNEPSGITPPEEIVEKALKGE